MFVAHLISTDLDHGHLLLADCIVDNPIAIGKIKHQLRDQSKQVMLYLFFCFSWMKTSKPWRPQTHTSSLLITRIRLYTLSLWLDKRGFGIWWPEKVDKRALVAWKTWQCGFGGLKSWQTWLWWPRKLDKHGFGDSKKFNVFIVALVTQKAFMSGPKTWQLWLQHSVTWKQSKCCFGDLKSEDKLQLDLLNEWIHPGIGLTFLFVTCLTVIHTFLLPSNVTKGAKEATIPVEKRS